MIQGYCSCYCFCCIIPLRLLLFRGCAFLKRLAVFFFSFFLLCSVSTSRSGEPPRTVQEPWEVPGPAGSMLVQTGQTQSQLVAQQTQPSPAPQQAQPQSVQQVAPQPQTQSTTVPTRIQRVEQVREQQERLRQQSAQGGIVPQVGCTAPLAGFA